MGENIGGDHNNRRQAPFDWRDFPFENVKILIFGKQKQGKKSLGNIILGKKLLDKNPEPGQDAEPWSYACNAVDGQQITVVDIPGCIPTAEDFIFSSNLLFPGLHALLFVIDGTASFTKHDEEYFETFLKKFDKDIIKHVIPVITHFDQIENNEQTYIQDTVNNNRYLEAVFRACDQRYVLIDSSPQRSHEDGQRIKQQRRLVLKVVSNLVRKRKTVITSKQILDEIFKQNDQEHCTLLTHLLNADKELLLEFSKKFGGTVSVEILVYLQKFPFKETQENIRVLKEVIGKLDEQRNTVALNTEIEDVAPVIIQHTDLLMKYGKTSTLTVGMLEAFAAMVGGGVVAVAAFLLGKKTRNN